MKSHITSTPFINSNKAGSLPASPNNSRLTPNVRSPKYLIASPSYGTPLRRPSDRGLSPMMNSTVNVSLYTNTQSPGLASRIVQYDKAHNGRSPTHNRKFGSPGIFPIVHLYKQNLPEVSPKPKKVTVKIAPPDDLSMYNRVEHSIIMSENARITKFPDNSSNESGTRSVLDALKEISRKRIHSTAEFETCPDGTNRKRNKRILETASSQSNATTNSLNITPQFNNSNTTSNKRAREESPPDRNCVSQSTTNIDSPINAIANNGNDKGNNPKRYCSIDPITASFTSANLRFQKLRNTGPIKRIQECQDDLPGSPLRKIQHVSVDTQTNLTELTTQSTEEVRELQTNDSPPQVTPPTKSSTTNALQDISVKIVENVIERPLFDPKPLEVIRRNKLAALLGAISGQTPVLEKVPLPDVLSTRQDDANIASNNLLIPSTSVLSNNISPFPSVAEQVIKQSKHVTFDLPTTNLTPILISNPNITQTTTALVLPISSSMIAPSASIPSAIDTTNFFGTTAIVPSSIVTNSMAHNSPPKIVGGFKFDCQQNTSANPITNALPLPTSSAATASTTLSNMPFNSTLSSITFNSAGPPIQTIALPSSIAAVSNVNERSLALTSLNSVVPSFGFKFATKSPQDAVISPHTQPISLETPKQPALSFGLPNPISTSNGTQALTSASNIASPSFNFGAATTATNSGQILFGSVGTSNSIISSTTSSTILTPSFSFAAKPAVLNIDAPKSDLTTTSAGTLPLYSGTTLAPNMFAKPSGISSNFQVPNEVTNAIAVPSPNVTTTNTIVGFPLTTRASITFGQLGTTSSLFGGTTTTNNSNNATATFSFGGSSTSNIPLTTNSNTTGLSFSSTVVGNNTVYKPTFGTSNKAPVVTTESSKNIFNASPFASSTNSGISSSSFGNFGSKFGETTVTVPAIQPSSQGVVPASNLFSFGNSTSTEQPKMFGNSVPNNSGTSTPTFGAPGAPKLTFGGFGTTNSTFGNNQTEVPPNQTVQANNSTFSFGSTNAFDASATFNKPNQGNPTFGGQQNSSFPTPSFSTPQQQQQPSKLFTFGTATAIPKAAEPTQIDNPSGVFAFGTPIAKPQATAGGFNFSTGGTSSFGAPPAPSFGASAAPAPVMFGSTQPAPAFNVSGGFNAPGLVGSPGMFSIGSGSSSSSTGSTRPRTQLKPKRRT